MTSGLRSHPVFVFLLFTFCFIIIPGILLLTGISYLRLQEHAGLIKSHQIELNRFFKTLQPFSDGQAFWCKFLTSELNPNILENSISQSNEKIIQKILLLRKNLNFNYIVFHEKKGLAASSIELEPRETWYTAIRSIQKRLGKRSGRSLSPQEEKSLGQCFGPQLNVKHLSMGTEDKPFLVWPDSSFTKPLLWCRLLQNHLIIVLIDYKEIKAAGGIWNFASNFSQKTGGKYEFAILHEEKNLILADNRKYLKPQISKAFSDYSKGKSTQFETKDLVIFPRFLRPGLTVLGFINKDQLKPPGHNHYIFIVLFFALISFFLGRYAYRIFILEIQDSTSLKWKLRFLFFFANGLPLLVLFFLGTDYLNQKKDTLLQETLAKGTKFLQSFDESFETEYAEILVNKRFAEEKLIRKLRKQELNNEILGEFVDQLGDYEKRVFLIASRGATIGTAEGLYDPKRGLKPKGFKEKSSSGKAQTSFTLKIGQYFLDAVNGIAISEKLATEIEILLESITQKPVVNFIFEMMQKRGNFTQWGFGTNVHPAIIDTFTLGTTKTEDYFFVAMFRKLPFQTKFLSDNMTKANRNHLGLRFVALKDKLHSFPLKAFKNESLKNFSITLTNFPGDEIKFVNYNNEQHLAMGFIGNSITEYKLIGLFPVSNIENIISRQKTQLSIFAILSLALTFALSQVLAHSFLVPLNHLSIGAKAIEDKHFSHRLPEMSHDEFGKMGEIFNDVMVDLDELSVASAIQEQLLPQGTIPTGNFSLYGESVSMGELGGDYYDFIELENNHFSVLLGDVAGHGVGAALIMAMAKAGIIQSEHLLDKPVELIYRLHNLIYSSKTKKQKKIMTFQYLYLDSQTGKGIYSNAGACSPMIIRKKENKVEELQLTGAALGAFRKGRFSEIPLSFETGDAIVFYTDGIVEARSDAGEEIGFDNLKGLLLRNWDMDAKKFYQNVYNEYLVHIGSQGAQDDLTMVILVFTGEKIPATDPVQDGLEGQINEKA